MSPDVTHTALKEQIEREIRENPVYLVMKGSPDFPQCGFSAGATRIAHTDALADLPAYRVALQEITRWPTLPQVFVAGEFLGGADLVREMLESGELAEKVRAAAG
jgi:monothiol glutaredoxin